MKKLVLLAVAALTLAACQEIPIPRPVNFSLPSATSGEDWNLADHKGKAVFIAAMSTGCGYCRISIPSVTALSERFKDRDIEIIAVFPDRTPQNLQQFIKDFDITFETLYDAVPLMQNMGVEGTPHYVLLDKNHTPYRAWSGYSQDHGWDAVIETVLAE